MIISANIATYPPRMHSLKQMIASIYDQVDVIRICFNEMTIEDVPDYILQLASHTYDGNHEGKIRMIFPNDNLTDNGKFYDLDNVYGNHEYYFTMDDDLIYPHDYVENTIQSIKNYGMIVTYHGRILKGKGLKYYYDHRVFRCLGKVSQDKKIDVCGTGVTAFDTRYFHPKGLANHPMKKMSDLTFSLEAARQGKKIGVMRHDVGWIRTVKHEENIFGTESRNGTPNQNNIANQIYQLNYGTD